MFLVLLRLFSVHGNEKIDSDCRGEKAHPGSNLFPSADSYIMSGQQKTA